MTITSSTDQLLARLPTGLRIVLDVGDVSSVPGKVPERELILKIGVPGNFGILAPCGEAACTVATTADRGDTIFENLLHDAFEALRAQIRADAGQPVPYMHPDADEPPDSW